MRIREELRPPAQRDEALLAELFAHFAGLEVLWEEQDFRRYQSGQPTVFSGAYIITALLYVCMWLMLKFCRRSGPAPSETQFRPQNL